MSNYLRWTRHPDTHHWHHAHWMDDHFGPHRYGVMFNDGKVFDPEKEDVETSMERPGDDEIIDATRDLEAEIFGKRDDQTAKIKKEEPEMQYAEFSYVAEKNSTWLDFDSDDIPDRVKEMIVDQLLSELDINMRISR